MVASEWSYWVRSSEIGLASRDRWNVPWVIDLIRTLILSHEVGAKGQHKACPIWLEVKCIPNEAIAVRKTVFKVKCLREAPVKVHREAYLRPLAQCLNPIVVTPL